MTPTSQSGAPIAPQPASQSSAVPGPSSITPSGARSFVLLHVGEQRFALNAEIVAELAPPVRLHSFPHTSPLVVGVIVRRGHIVPVYDAGPVLAGRSFSEHRFYLIARRCYGDAYELSAIPVNGECELITGHIRPPREGAPSCTSGALQVGEEAVDVLDFEALVSSKPKFHAEAISPESRS